MRRERPLDGDRNSPFFRYSYLLLNATRTITRAIERDSCAFKLLTDPNEAKYKAEHHDCRALHAPVDNLESNWAYMVMTSLAWTLKAWIGLSIPVDGR